ncbi:MAG TPA: hypothetical protein DEO86_01325, partial [Colwellia sp.]|nr:hypothetical protein [Colwellia sp.]
MQKFITITILITALCFQLNVHANQMVNITGRLLDESKLPLSNVTISLNDKSVTSDKQGQFNIATVTKDIYQLNFVKKGYFKNIQTFSHHELFVQKKEKANAVIADLTLVSKKTKRVMLAFGGDVMMDRRYYKPYFGDSILIHPETRLSDSKAIVENIKPYMSIADYAAVNLETQIADKTPGER